MAKPSISLPNDNVVNFVRRQLPRIEKQSASGYGMEQLAFDLDEPRQMLIVSTDKIHGATFLRCLLQSRPKAIVDLRFAPHFNFTAVDSLIVKKQIENLGVRYVHYSIPFHEFGSALLRHDPMKIASNLSIIARESGTPQWPLMILVKEISVANAFSPFMIGALSKDLGGKWTAIVVT
jgi:hypothetical protein